jgi:hypothetical protein
VTIDDDTLYPSNFLQRLIDAYERHRCIVAFSGRKVVKDFNGKLKAYQHWQKIMPPEDVDMMNFPIGNDGVLYRPEFFTRRIFDPIVLEICPYADDIWFRCNSWLKQVRACILGTSARMLPQIKGNNRNALWKINQFKNDQQIQATADYMGLQFLKNGSIAVGCNPC